MWRNPAVAFRGRTMFTKFWEASGVRTRSENANDGRGQVDNFKVRELVPQNNIMKELQKGGKPEANLLGPLTISKLEGKSADLVNQRGKKKIKINIDQLIHCPARGEGLCQTKKGFRFPSSGLSITDKYTRHTQIPACQKAPRPAKKSILWAFISSKLHSAPFNEAHLFY